ncbi:aminotransferase class IV [Ruminococcus sp. OA3]|uniref:aminotransferase class IV n=1 Tax=Ruminococcus sp. OA3 TaxID=2914164 RepID=UPI001F0524FC|nr:aminotransferase class IV [Ruminococcus sp. OA3]MCH1981067.1 aminotransferase class IV [Ruminococcus sp. OA3]
MKDIGYYNGERDRIEALKVPMTDRALYFGDGCYDATRIVNRIPFALDEHIERFCHSCRLLEIEFPYDAKTLKGILMGLVSELDDDEGLLYWQTSRGLALREHAFPETKGTASLLAYARPASMCPVGQELQIISLEDTRFYHCHIKSLNLLPNVIASQRAKEVGCQEAVFHRGGRVTECSRSSILMLKDGVLCTPPLDRLILPGITRAHLLQLAKELLIPVSEEAFSLKQLCEADEIIVCSSGALCNRVSKLDGRTVGGRAPELLKKLQDAYVDKFKRETGQI